MYPHNTRIKLTGISAYYYHLTTHQIFLFLIWPFSFPFPSQLIQKKKKILIQKSLQQNVTTVTNFSEENIFVTKKYHIVTKFIFRH